MLPKYHICLGAILSITLYLFIPIITPFNAILIFLASFLMDIDHYIWFVKRKKVFSIKKAYLWHLSQKQSKPIMHLFHTIEFLSLILILSFFWKDFLFVAMGMTFHSILDVLTINLKGREYLFIRYLISDKGNYL